MKNLLLSLLLLFFYSCAGSGSGDKWSSVTYMFESGPLPPKYQYSYNLTIQNNGTAGFVGFIGADPSNSSITYDFKCTPEEVKKISDAIVKSKILEGEIKELPDGERPVGGHLEKARIVLVQDNPNLDRPPAVKESPYFPADKYRDGLNKLYETLQKTIPEKIWFDFEGKKSEFQKKSE